MGKKPNMDKGSADPHQDRKFRLIFLERRIVDRGFGDCLNGSVVHANVSGVVALLDFISAGPAGAVPP